MRGDSVDADRVWWRSPIAWLGIGAVAVGLVAAVIGYRWWTTDHPPTIAGGGWSSDDLESIVIGIPFEQRRVFHCEPGEIEAWIEVVAPPDEPVYLESVEVESLDGVWADVGWVSRVRTQRMRTPSAPSDDLVEFDGAQLNDERGGWLRMRLAWEIHECPGSAFTTIDSARFNYRNGRRSRSTDLTLVPLVLTSKDLDDVIDEAITDLRSSTSH